MDPGPFGPGPMRAGPRPIWALGPYMYIYIEREAVQKEIYVFNTYVKHDQNWNWNWIHPVCDVRYL